MDMLNRVCFLLYIIHVYMLTCNIYIIYIYVYIWASGSEPCLWQILSSYISFHRLSTMSLHVLQANIKPAHCKFKGRTFSANFVAASNPTNPCSLSTTDHPWAWTVLMPAERLSIWTGPQPRYAFSAVNHSNGLVPQFIKCAMCSSLWSDVA